MFNLTIAQNLELARLFSNLETSNYFDDQDHTRDYDQYLITFGAEQ